MNRNAESYFSELPKIEISRSIFDRSHSHKTSFNVGQLIPFFWDEVLPGDTYKVTTSFVARLQTLLTPIMDNMYIDTYYFFVPMRLTWSHTKEFFGENTTGPWFPQSEYTLPILKYPSGGFDIGTVADYMGIPTGVGPLDSTGAQRDDSEFPISLPLRAYALICNEWFRNQNLTDPLQIPVGDATQTGSNGDNYITDVVNGGQPFKVAKYHDYFTSALPSPQKGDAVQIPLGSQAPVMAAFTPYDTSLPGSSGPDGSYSAIRWKEVNASGSAISGTDYYLRRSSGTSDATASLSVNAPGTSGYMYLTPANLYADLGQATAASINDLRLAFQLQKFYEKNARGGTRMREMLHEHFGVVSPDARMQIPEYLGGHRVPLSIHQVANTSQGEQDFLGDLGAMSNTSDVHDDFIQSFSEPGYVLGVCCVRYDHSYPQGLERAWSRRRLTDLYFPVFANIGEQPIYKREIYAAGDDSGQVFGYNEAWAEYRYKPNRVSGEMRPGHDRTLDSWHLADYYTMSPSLSDGWIREDLANVDRVLASTSENQNQVFCDFYVNCQATRPMPVHSIPGLIDHH